MHNRRLHEQRGVTSVSLCSRPAFSAPFVELLSRLRHTFKRLNWRNSIKRPNASNSASAHPFQTEAVATRLDCGCCCCWPLVPQLIWCELHFTPNGCGAGAMALVAAVSKQSSGRNQSFWSISCGKRARALEIERDKMAMAFFCANKLFARRA